jgi:uncharacterized membrane protein YeiH
MLTTIEFFAVVSSAMYGILLGCRKRFDAVGLFAVSGAIAFGGVIADVICNEIPSLFRSAPLHATCAFIGAWVYLLLGQAGAPAQVTMPAGLTVIFLLRMAALKWDIRLPSAEDGE